ncbi:VOC family protein [Novosphingobium resinovorum]
MTQQSSETATETAAIIPPVRLAHFVLRTSRFREVIDWYKTVLGAEAAFENEILAFLSYDEEHHRVAVLNMPDLEEQKDGVAGFHHAAFTYDSLGDLMATYKRLRDVGITPVFPINHGPTTSMYYQDPDGNQIELQVDNYDNIEDATAFFYSRPSPRTRSAWSSTPKICCAASRRARIRPCSSGGRISASAGSKR